MPPCQNFDPDLIAAWANVKTAGQSGDQISAVIPVARPPADRLNRCLAAILEQVHEIIVTSDAGGAIPAGAMRHPKIRYVQSRFRDLGYGRNVNFGARHTSGQWLWLLNDDCFPAGDCAQKLKDCATEGVGLIGHLLRYPDGKIQHGGKFRKPGMRGWGHIDQGLMTSTVQAPAEMENVTGASILVRRKAFYEIGGNDEDFIFYAVDDAMCLSLRQAGYKIMFTPFAEAIHQEAATSRETGRIAEFVSQGNAAFDHKWGYWITANLNRIPGTFDC